MDNLFDILEDDTKLKKPVEFGERTVIHTVDSYTMDNTVHEAVTPNKEAYTKLDINQPLPAKDYAFKLDTFQQIALAAIEADRSVLVSAHTSCGKTVVAEYAIAKSIGNKQRVIYTSPIKALSNQKFRELQEEFGDVGLMTGDVTLNPEATCLVMTTEILRNMLYRGAEITREIHWIIFDEIHYLKDRERGVVWEETIILVRDYVRLIFLSATIPNAREFAEWIARVHGQVVHVLYTENRVIPLVHYFYSDKMYEIRGESKTAAISLENVAASQEAVIRRNETADALLACLDSINLPAVVFSFARTRCEYFANKVTRNLLTADESALASTIFENAIQSLSEEDRGLLAVQSMRDLFVRGVGVHHSGLLPIVKEIGEILFQEGLIRVLFATESFSIGLNMPAKTVLFTSLKKFDGVEERALTPAEYCQMAGRAGRRGLDHLGVVVSLVTEKMQTEDVLRMFQSAADPLNSAFRLTYNMILNLMRIEELDPTYFLERSFYHHQAHSAAARRNFSLREFDDDFGILDQITRYGKLLLKEGSALVSEYRDGLMADRNRLVEITEFKEGCFSRIEVGVLVQFKTSHQGGPDSVTVGFVCDGAVVQKDFLAENITGIFDKKIKRISDIKKVVSMGVELTRIGGRDSSGRNELMDLRSRILADSRVAAPFRLMMTNCCILCGKQTCLFSDDEISLDPPDSMNQTVYNYRKTVVNRIRLNQQNERISELRKLREIYHMDECRKMIGVLRDLDFLDGNTVKLKGKMASEISSADEILLTEMIFNSAFNRLTIENVVALVSILVTERSKEGNDIVLSDANIKAVELFNASIDKIVESLNRNGIDTTRTEYVQNYSFYMMDIVKLWMGGASFAEICKGTNVFEGSIIRSFKRLEELLRQLSSAATVIGNNELVNLFGQGIYLIKRDIVFANSLYI
ncbi:SK2L2 [Enterospora canceri]|uniref:SK2L2 n=1 Tax=Enterospora canceri TaxID=1081671 RepID=A0A1Y1S793_9MICR|nr:SK2L2 [Enterospora canceri]